jgi:hypothetical protein
VGELAGGDRQDDVPASLEVGALGAVALERPTVGVVLPGVDFDDEPLGAPQEVDFVAVEPDVYCRLGKVGRFQQAAQDVLGRGAGEAVSPR